MIDQERLMELLSYDASTGVFRWKIRPSNRVKVGDVAGCIATSGYVLLRLDHTLYKAHRLAWLYHHGGVPAVGIDHIDRNPSNNAISNLRVANQSQNMQNVGLQKNNVSGVAGVFWYAKNKRWGAYIAIDRKRKYLGFYTDKNRAISARKAAEKQLHPYRRFA